MKANDERRPRSIPGVVIASVFLLPWVIVAAVVLPTSHNQLVTKQTVPVEELPDTKEAKQVMDTIKRAYEIEANAVRTFDLTQFPTVFINDPRGNVKESTVETVRELTNNPSLKTAGCLDYKVAYYSWRRDGAIRYETIYKQAASEGRSLTEAEVQSLVDSTGRIAPPRRQDPVGEIYLDYYSIEINDDVAKVVLNDGPWTCEYTLVLVDGNWYIAGSRGLSFHP